MQTCLIYRWPIFLMLSIIIFGCKRESLNVTQDFPFSVEVMPVPKEVAKQETVEIRCRILKTGNYDTKYYLRYFQFDGRGTLRLGSGPAYTPNDLYSLPGETFRLYYTSASNVTQSFDIWISDSFGNERKISFQFNNRDVTK